MSSIIYQEVKICQVVLWQRRNYKNTDVEEYSMNDRKTMSTQEMRELLAGNQLKYLDAWQQDLLADAVSLAEKLADKQDLLTDFSAMVFPASKAYEGFLKQYLRDLDLIDDAAYKSKRFRIGRALNPDIRQSQRDEWWLYDDVVKMCGPELGRKMWNTWLECRNRLFHYFPAKPVLLTHSQACTSISTLLSTMSEAIACHWDTLGNTKKEHHG